MTVDAIAAELAAHPSILGKLDIAGATRALGLSGNSTGQPGDDAAALPRPEGGWDLFAAEAFIPAFVADDPWFAGWCGVMVNLSDIAAMGGQATAITDMIWAPDAASAAPVLEGLFAASKAYGVPIVGGHTNLRAPSLNLSVAVTGRARALISSFAARPDDMLIAAVDLRGAWRPRFDNWFAATDAPASRLRGDLALLPELAESGLVRAGKDISQGGIARTSLMLGECSGCGFEIDLDRLPMPPGVDTRPQRHRDAPGLQPRPSDIGGACHRGRAAVSPASAGQSLFPWPVGGVGSRRGHWRDFAFSSAPGHGFGPDCAWHMAGQHLSARVVHLWQRAHSGHVTRRSDTSDAHFRCRPHHGLSGRLRLGGAGAGLCPRWGDRDGIDRQVSRNRGCACHRNSTGSHLSVHSEPSMDRAPDRPVRGAPECLTVPKERPTISPSSRWTPRANLFR